MNSESCILICCFTCLSKAVRLASMILTHSDLSILIY